MFRVKSILLVLVLLFSATVYAVDQESCDSVLLLQTSYEKEDVKVDLAWLHLVNKENY